MPFRSQARAICLASLTLAGLPASQAPASSSPAAPITSRLEIREIRILEVATPDWPSAEADWMELTVTAGEWSPALFQKSDAMPVGDAGVQAMTADDDGWFRSDSLTRGYAHAVVQVPLAGSWVLEGMGFGGVYVNGEPRVGNLYGYTDDWESWQPRFDYARMPVRLNQGQNHLLFFGNRYGVLRATLRAPATDLALNELDVTLPSLVEGEAFDGVGAIVVLNNSSEFVSDARLVVSVDGQEPVATEVPILPPVGVRKVAFPIYHPRVVTAGPKRAHLQLLRRGAKIAETSLDLSVKQLQENRRVTFVSEIDGSVQYYGFLPARGSGPRALVLTLHGAGVETINHSGSYAPLDWAHIVAPTNRRPFGFSWEDWGRLDALEVLDLAQRNLEIEPDRIYLTGHSMGGHGSWHLGTLHPDRFAAVGPSAGWISMASYRFPPRPGKPSSLVQMVERATLPGRTLEMAPNLQTLGIYILHGSDDDNVPPEQAHMMVERLDALAQRFEYHQEPGVGHWWDQSPEPGTDCVTWAPMFDFFTRHRRPAPAEVRHVRFQTPGPSVSAWNHWACVAAQQSPFVMSRIDLRLDPGGRRLQGTTENVASLGLDLRDRGFDSIDIALDGHELHAPVSEDGHVWLRRDEGDGGHSVAWQVSGPPSSDLKGHHRGSGFREAFTRAPVLVAGTGGSPEENAWALAKARYDAEWLWYHGNASIEVVTDRMFDPEEHPDRNVVLYGNADMHGDWAEMWPDEALVVSKEELRLGQRGFAGDDLGVLAVRPRPGSATAAVGIVGGTGLAGMRLTERRPYLTAGYAYPDVTLLRDDYRAGQSTPSGPRPIVLGAGFFGRDWTVASGEFVWSQGRP